MIAKVCVIANEDIVPGTKYWTKQGVSVNRECWVCHQALERPEVFHITERKYERIRGGAIARTGI